MEKSKSGNKNLMTIQEAEQLLNDLVFFAEEMAFLVKTMKDHGLNEFEVFSCNNIKIGHERMMPGLARLRHSVARAVNSKNPPELPKIITSEIKKIAETVQKFKKGKKHE